MIGVDRVRKGLIRTKLVRSCKAGKFGRCDVYEEGYVWTIVLDRSRFRELKGDGVFGRENPE